MKCFYHNDADGHCAGYWVSTASNGEVRESDFIPMQYGDRFPLEIIANGEKVWIVDFSISLDDMRCLLSVTKDVIWIDHHESSLKKYEGFEHKVNGLRHNGISGCELTYCYVHEMSTYGGKSEENMIEFNPDMCLNAPLFTQLIGDRDVWKFKFGKKTKDFHEGLLLNGIPAPLDQDWVMIEEGDLTVKDLCRNGRIVGAYKTSSYRDHLEKYSFEVDFEGYKVLACNGRGGSDAFGEKLKDYPFVIQFVFTGDHYIVNMYSNEMKINGIAEKYGGGGHSKACGFTCEKLPFKKR